MRVRPPTTELINGLQDAVIVNPSLDRGLFMQERGRFRDVGEVAVLYGIQPEEMPDLSSGDQDLLMTYFQIDPVYVGRLVVVRGAKIQVVRDSYANQPIAPGLITSYRSGTDRIDEFQPVNFGVGAIKILSARK